MEPSIGVNLRVTAHSNQGGRKYMEDMFCVAYQPTSDERDLLYAYFGIFDGHGGREAANYAKNHLMDNIVTQRNFWADDDSLVLRAIRDGFINTHYAMWKEVDKWPKTATGLPSTSGTTASIIFVRRGKIYIGHVGDSSIVMGAQDPGSNFWKAGPLTKEHKPESDFEIARINQCGGKVVSKSGVPRVVWNRPRVGHKGPVRRSTLIDEIPFLAVARSLGDLWSYNSVQDEFVVSPEPDVCLLKIDVNVHRCLILGSDGLWNMLTPQDAVHSVYVAEKNNEQLLHPSPDSTASSSETTNWINPSKKLVDTALEKWASHGLRADNTTVITVVIDPPGPPKAHRTQLVRTLYASPERDAAIASSDPSSSNSGITDPPSTRKYSVPFPGAPGSKGCHGSPNRGQQRSHGDVSSVCSADNPSSSRGHPHSAHRSEARGQATRGKSSPHHRVQKPNPNKVVSLPHSNKKERQTSHEKSSTGQPHSKSSSSPSSSDVQIHEISSSSEPDTEKRSRRKRKESQVGTDKESNVSRHSTRLSSSVPSPSSIPRESRNKRKRSSSGSVNKQQQRSSTTTTSSDQTNTVVKKRKLRSSPGNSNTTEPSNASSVASTSVTPDRSPSAKKRKMNSKLPSSVPIVKQSKKKTSKKPTRSSSMSPQSILNETPKRELRSAKTEGLRVTRSRDNKDKK